MKLSRFAFLYSAILIGTVPLFADVHPLLPVPLKLPPGLVEILPVDKTGSFMGDSVRIIDCPNDADNPLGTCSNVLFGGAGIYNSHLTGLIQIQFYPPVNNIAHFEISHPSNLVGDDVVLRTPQFYAFGATSDAILDTFDGYSSGDLNLLTGEVTNLDYKVIFFNIFYYALGIVNPKLKPPAFEFPGIYGSADLLFEQRKDGLLDFTFYGSTFLPLGSNVNGDPVRLPMPFCGPLVQCASIQVPGMSLHPHLRVTSKPFTDPPCGIKCAAIVPNSVIEMTLNSRFSSIGDDFLLNIPQLGPALGFSQMQGRIKMQFGDQTGDFVPVSISALPPDTLLVPPPDFPIAGLSLGFIGFDEKLRFSQTYDVQNVAITDDPFDVPVGELNVKTGTFVGGMLWRTFWTTTVLLAIQAQNNGRIIPQSFFLRGPARFDKGANDQITFHFQGTEFRPFESYVFPFNDLNNPARSFTAQSGSLLTPFFNMQAVTTQDTPTVVLSGSQTNIVSSFGETFSYTFSIPCSGTGKDPLFTYTANGSGPLASASSEKRVAGTFTMNNLASVTCFNSTTSKLPAGNYDNIAFTGYGTWSADDDPSGLHLATVHVSLQPDAPFVAIEIDGGTVSNVDLKPSAVPVP